jgi:TrmH family RNA methyltransferase
MDQQVRTIESADNPLFKDLRKLLNARGIKKQGRAILAGARLTAEACLRHPDRCRAWLVPAGKSDAAAPADGRSVYRLTPALFRELDLFGTHVPLLVLDVPEIPRWDPAEGLPPGASLLVPFQDPENTGAVIRSAAAFGVDRVILLAESAHPFHPKTLRSSGGAVLQVPLMDGPSLAALPPDPAVVPLSAEGADIGTFTFPERFGLLPGIEGKGLPAAWRERAVAVPIRAEVESLNAAAATAIALYVWSKGRSESSRTESRGGS